jgi:hypothetical protein
MRKISSATGVGPGVKILKFRKLLSIQAFLCSCPENSEGHSLSAGRAIFILSLQHPTRSQSVNVRRQRNQVPITPQKRHQIIKGYEENVCFLGASSCRDNKQACEENENFQGNVFHSAQSTAPQEKRKRL